MKNWKTNLGGAVSALGTSLVGIGVLGNMTEGPHHAFLWWTAALGFVLSCVGKFFTALFAADASTVKALDTRVQNVEDNTTQITNNSNKQ